MSDRYGVRATRDDDRAAWVIDEDYGTSLWVPSLELAHRAAELLNEAYEEQGPT